MSKIQTLQRRAVGTLALVSPRCGHLLKCPVPLEKRIHTIANGEGPRNLFVFLPGIQDRHLDFELAGFMEAARRQGLDADLIAVDAHIGYYVREMILERLREDIIRPAREKGYENIWLVGTSLGGLGAALYARHYELDINGLFLMAPYLGERELVQKIENAGGPALWTPGSDVPLYQISLWRWLRNYYEDPKRTPPLYLGLGDRDKFAYANRFLAQALPEDQTLILPGRHDWPTWKQLWDEFLSRDPIASGRFPH